MGANKLLIYTAAHIDRYCGSLQYNTTDPYVLADYVADKLDEFFVHNQLEFFLDSTKIDNIDAGRLQMQVNCEQIKAVLPSLRYEKIITSTDDVPRIVSGILKELNFLMARHGKDAGVAIEYIVGKPRIVIPKSPLAAMSFNEIGNLLLETE